MKSGLYHLPCLQKWPKFKSQLKVIWSWELWKGHIKEIEGQFGTAVVSYFIFLRFIFGMNSFVSTFWFSFITIPTIIYLQLNSPPGAASLVSCAYQPTNNSDALCPTDSLSVLGTNVTLEMGTFVYQLEVSGEYSCSFPASFDVETFEVRDCSFEGVRFNDSLSYMVAQREGTNVINVSATPITGVCLCEPCVVCVGILWPQNK